MFIYFFFKWFFIFTVILFSSCQATHFFATKYEERFAKPLGRLIDIGGRKLHLYELGTEHVGPTVVLIHSGGGTHLDWQKIQPEIAKFARVISYDQAGFGWSDESSEELTSKNSAKDLLKLLENANLSGPYILVGHSVGGFVVRELCSISQDNVFGAILVDSTYEYSADLSDTKDADQKQFSQMLKVFSWLPIISRTGIFRCAILFQNTPFFPKFIKTSPKKIVQTYKKFFGWTKTWRSLFNFYKNVMPSCESIKSLENGLTDKPLIILASGKWDHNIEFAGKFMNYQKELAKLSNKSEFIVAEDAGHDIANEQPEIVIESIKKLILKAKDLGYGK